MAARRLGDILVEKKLITQKALEHALLEQRKTNELLGRTLVRLGYLTEQQLLEGLSVHLEVPLVDLAQFPIDARAIKQVPVRFAWHYRCMPLRLKGKTLTLAMADPLNVHAVEDVELITGCAVQTFVSTASDIREAINKYYQSK